MSWQKRARYGVAIFGIVSAGVVYRSIGERRVAAPLPAVHRLDPAALFESTKGLLKQVRGGREDYSVTFDRQLTYENGRSKLFGVRVAVKQRDGRDFDVRANEAEAGENQRILQLTGEVKLAASDGFEMATDAATYNQDTGVVTTTGKVTFRKERMNGYGTGTTYDQHNDVLTIAHDAHVEMHDDAGNVTLDFDAGTATLDRMQDLLTLDGMVHALRDQQTIEADHAVAHLDAEDQFITRIELRGNSRVQGSGGSLDAMSARDIDLDYTDDGQTLQHVSLSGGAGVALTGQNGAAGRTITGDVVDLQLAPDATLTRLAAHDPRSVRLVLPAADGSPARSIEARTLDATGVEGKGLTEAQFTDAVEFREEAQKGTSARTVHARSLQVALTDASVGAAVFKGAVTFEEQGLKAGAAELHYAPDAGTLELTGRDSGGGPNVADDRITIEAQTIAIRLQGRHMIARTNVKTTLRPQPTTTEDRGRIPGMLKQDQPANVNATTSLEYDGAAGRATYVGAATLWQSDTSVRADTIVIDQQSGDMIATGNATARLALEMGDSVGQAYEIRYQDAKRVITYTPPAAATAAATAAPAAVMQPHLSGPQGDLKADRLEVFLAADAPRLERLEAYNRVSMTIDAGTPSRRIATGGRLTYRAASEQYDMVGTAAAPVKVVDACREITGKTLTFYKSADRITVDGQEEIRTETKSGGPCTPSSSPRPSRP
jgi:lipopolysaccharide export system protein LptA